MPDRPIYSINEFAATYGLGRSTVYRLLRSGDLKARKIGKRTVIAAEDAESWLGRLQAYKPKAA
jgi:excisionase family DNA binding protein